MEDNKDLDIAKTVLQKEASSILKASERISSTFAKAIDILLTKDQKIIVSGIGKSGHLGKKISATLCSTGSPSSFLHPAEALHGDLGIHQTGDPVIFLSNSGSTPELIALAPILKSRNAQIVGIFGRLEGKLNDLVDVSLDAGVGKEADPLGIVPTASFAVASSIGDAIASVLMNRRGFTEIDYAVTHPAGQLGRNLVLTVKDVMHTVEKTAIVDENATIRDVVVKMTTHPLGAACVLNHKRKLVGLISDGDLRRALHKFQELKDIKARDIMTENPVVIEPNTSLGMALEKMEKRKSAISVLPVIDPPLKGVIGMIRIHDILNG
jgi:arabinose-5-phosphate isomerase